MVDALAIIVARRILSTTGSRAIEVTAASGAAGIVLLSVVAVSLGTTTVQTMVVMTMMGRHEPYASILKDRHERPLIRQAVENGLSMRTGTMRGNVASAVREVVEPYMAYRLKSTSDAQIVALAKIMIAALEKARAQDGNECAMAASGDTATLRKYVDEPTMDAWLKTTLREEPLDEPSVSTGVTVKAFTAQAVASHGIGPQDLARAAADAHDPISCDVAVTTLRTAITLPTEKAAAVLRGMGIARNVSLR